MSNKLVMIPNTQYAIFEYKYISVTEQARGAGSNDILLPNGPTLVLWAPPLHTRFALPATRERRLSMPEIGEKGRNYLFKKLYRLRVMT